MSESTGSEFGHSNWRRAREPPEQISYLLNEAAPEGKLRAVSQQHPARTALLPQRDTLVG